MGQPVVHFEVIGKDGERLKSYYSELFGWQIDSDNPMDYGTIAREANTNADGAGIGGGVAKGPEGYEGHVTFYVEVPDVGASLAKAQELGGTTIFGPDEIPGIGLTLGQFADPEGHMIGLVQSR
jgi:uncharacterized protein